MQTSDSIQLFLTPVSQGPPLGGYPEIDHPQPPVGSDIKGPIQTNNTFNNLLLDDQTFPTWPLPYLIWVAKDSNTYYGLAVNHTEKGQLVFGPDPNKVPVQFYFNPPKIKLFCFSGKNWETQLQVEVTDGGNMYSSIKASGGGCGTLTMHMVYGMGFVTAIYENESPVIHSAVGVQDFQKIKNLKNEKITKYTARLYNQVTWSLYVTGDCPVELFLKDPNHIGARTSSKKVIVQLAKGDYDIYDECCGTYPVKAELSGSVDAKNMKGTYSIKHVMEGGNTGLIWALPHHQATLTCNTKKMDTGITLDSPTKGLMKAYKVNQLDMEVINLPTCVNFEPYTTVNGFEFNWCNYTDKSCELIKQAATKDSQQNISQNCDLDSMYFGGKQLDKYAYVAYVCHFILRDSGLTQEILPKVKAAIEKFARNKQKNPLAYDRTWKGIISNTPPSQDFGNSNYNDHHFHYGYHIHAIALVGSIDPHWLDENNCLIRNYAYDLVRDYSNPVEDEYFPQFRNFDWYHGHSFAHGIFPSGDGKNEESSLEDYHAQYAIKLFAKVIGNKSLEMTANLMLGIMRTSMNMYMLYSDDNVQQPAQFKGNKVSGILFENKIDFATFFGRGTIGNEWVHGIHMLPITPISSYIRGPQFVKQEWDETLADIVDRIPDGWKGVLKLNLGLFDPKSSWKWFARDDWQDNLIDGGMSRSWSLAYLAGIGAAKT